MSTSSSSTDFLRWVSATGPWSLAAVHQGTENISCLTTRDMDVAMRFIANHSNENLYLQVNLCDPRLGSHRAGKEDVVVAQSLHVDLDPPKGLDADGLRAWQGQMAGELEAWRSAADDVPIPAPSAVVFSGSGFQLLWRLADPVLLGSADESGWSQDPALVVPIESANYALLRAIAPDCPGTHNVDRLLRLPGTTNYPNKKKRANGRTEAVPTSLLWISNVTHPLAAFPSQAPPADAKRERPIADRVSVAIGEPVTSDELAQMVPPWLLREVCDPPEAGVDRSKRAGGLVCRMLEVGVTDETVAAVLSDPAYALSGHFLDQQDVERAINRTLNWAHEQVDDSIEAAEGFRNWIATFKSAAPAKKSGLENFLSQFQSDGAPAMSSTTSAGAPTIGLITSTLESKRDSYRRASGEGAEQCERRYLGTLLLRVLRAGKDDLFEDAIEFDHAVEAVVSCAPVGTTAEQVATIISAVAGKHRDRAPSVIAEAFQRCGARARQLQAQSQTDAPPSRNVQLAARFVDNHMHPDGPCIRVWREGVYYWDPEGGRYFECDGDRLAQMLYTELGLEDKRAYSDVVHALRGVPNVLVDKDRYDLGSLLPGGSSSFDPRNAIACTNGLLNLTTGELLPPTPRFFATHVIGAAYDPNAGQPTEWLKFLDSVFPGDPESIACLQEIFGLLLTTDTRYQKIFMFVGLPRSGKGTVLRILRKLLQDNVAAPKTSRLGESFGLESAIGKPVAVISDSRLTGRTDCGPLLETLLSVSGEDAQGVNRKHKQDWTGQMFARFVIATNELLRFDDPSGALAARIVMLRFGETFVGREDTSLTDRLLAELPQILLWAVEGWRNLHARGKFIQATSSQSELEQLADLADPVGAWMRATCEVGTDPKTGERFAVAKNVARSSYSQWCLQQEIVPANAIEFGRKLSAKGYRAGQLSDKSRTPTYVGFRLRPPEAVAQGAATAPFSPPVILTLN